MPAVKKGYKFNLGNFECLIMKDGPITGPDKKKVQTPGTKILTVKIMDISCLLIKTPAHTVLIDSGFGSGARLVIGGIPQNVGHMLQVLQNEGLSPLEIDTVILSHAHPDHIGGVMDQNGQPVFPNARHVIHRQEWDFWQSNPDLSRVEENFKQVVLAAIARNLIPLRNRLDLVSDGTEIVPGIKLVSTPGHTPGHASLIISSGKEQMVSICDLMHGPPEITRPDYARSSDMLIEQSSLSRDNILAWIVKSGALVFACHFPFPGLGYVIRQNDGYRWKPCR